MWAVSLGIRMTYIAGFQKNTLQTSGAGDNWKRGDKYLISQLDTCASDLMTCPLCFLGAGIGKTIQECLEERDSKVKLSFTVIFHWDEDVPFSSRSREHQERHPSFSSMVHVPLERTDLWERDSSGKSCG